MRRPAPYVPLSVTFATGRTGTAIQKAHGLEGLAVWSAMIAAAKRGRGQILFAHETDWQAIGLFHHPGFTLSDFLRTTGRRKQTRITRLGRTLYVQLTQYEQWNNDSDRQLERERKTCKSPEKNRKVTGRLPEGYRKATALELELEKEEDITKAVEKGRSGPNGPKARESINKKLRGAQ